MKPARKCGIQDCDRPLQAYGFCSMHAARFRRTGTTDAPRRPSVRDRLLARLIVDPSGCLLWTGARWATGYGRITVDGRSRQVHRVMWELFEGPIPAGLTLDHVRDRGCTNRHCASIAHLEPVTERVNILRGTSPSAINAAKVRCKCGREYDAIKADGRRICRACHRKALRKYRETKRAREFAHVLSGYVVAEAEGQPYADEPERTRRQP